MLPFLAKQKLHFKLTEEAGGISLTRALAGEAGTVHLGENAINLWTPQMKALNTQEAVCDLRFLPLEEKIYEHFAAATKGMFLPAHVAVFHGCDAGKIKYALTMFDLVLTPNNHIKNKPIDIYTKRVLAYKTPRYARAWQDLSKPISS